MHPPDCPAKWEYQDVTGFQQKLSASVRAVLLELGSGEIDPITSAADTRPIHQRFFQGLTPPDCDYFAGHYRGEPLKCLEHLEVGVQSDPVVGAPPKMVPGLMNDLRRLIENAARGLEAGFDLPNSQLPAVEKLKYAVAAVCRVFEFFLRVHPYANGNGHAARFCITALLWRYGYQLRRFPVDPRPGPPYIAAIKAYRAGKPALLEEFILNCLLG